MAQMLATQTAAMQSATICNVIALGYLRCNILAANAERAGNSAKQEFLPRYEHLLPGGGEIDLQPTGIAGNCFYEGILQVTSSMDYSVASRIRARLYSGKVVEAEMTAITNQSAGRKVQIVYGSVTASFCCEGFGLCRTTKITREAIDQRVAHLETLIRF